MMKNVKKLFLSIISLVGVASLAACGSGSEGGATKEDTPAVTYYVTPDARADGKGTKESPVPFSVAAGLANPGDTILLAKGTYKYSSRQQVMRSGDAGKYITVKPEVEGERVIFDFSRMNFDGSNRGIQIYGNYWHFYKLEICGAGDNGMYVAGSHNIIEECLFYNNRDTGLQLGRGYSEDTHLDDWPAYNLILNCTSFANYDGETLGENADGFAAKLTIGYGNVFDGCIAYRNSDDGWDLFAKVDSGNIGTVYLYNCVSFENGYLPYTIKAKNSDGTEYNTYNTPNGDGIGFKLGGSTMEGDVVLNNCMSFNNKLHGYGDNSNPGMISINYSTAFNNCIGLNDDGKVSNTRGIADEGANKSNNIDLARSNASYNNYVGVLSYINNQANFSTENDNSYNQDAFRGSTSYSIFNTGYNKGEVYKAFKGYVDASSYHSTSMDAPFSGGENYTGLKDSSFAKLDPINAICDSVNDLDKLVTLQKSFRNPDGSINMGDQLKVVDQELLKFANGSAIGANLTKTTSAEYPHTSFVKFDDKKYFSYETEKIDLISAYNFCNPITDLSATFQDFDIPKLITGCDISWTSSNEEILKIDTNEDASVSNSVFSTVHVTVPKEDTVVKLTAKLTKNGYYLTRDFDVTVKPRNQALGQLASTGSKAVRVELYDVFNEPVIYALDASSNGGSRLPETLYNLRSTYRFATSGNSEFYDVDGVYTSVAGVYEVTTVATHKTSGNTSEFKYNVYVVDPECDIDFMGGAQEITLTKDGFTIYGELSNIDGSVATVVSDEALTNLKTAEDIINHEDVQYYPITTDSVLAEFKADNFNVKSGDTQYYVYYVVLNRNKSNLDNKIRNFSITNIKVNTEEEFYRLARGTTESSSTNIYSLQKDLDFAEFDWIVTEKDKSKAFTGLLNGNGHTVKNITIEGTTVTSNNEKYNNVFYKISNGTLMNINFDNIIINVPQAKVVGIVGDFQGGYLYKIKVTRVGMVGKESVGGLVGQITGKDNYLSEISVVNPLPDKDIKDHSKTVANDYIPEVYKFSASNKYIGAIVGNVQMNSDQTYLYVHADNCYAEANVGDGNDAQGNIGGILGRVKNDTVNYKTYITNCVFYGTIISKGQYQGGMIGDLDNGSGYTYLAENVSMARFVWSQMPLDAYVAAKEFADQKYAHKNSNPMIGRATLSELGKYETAHNYGTWKEYYESNGIDSLSFAFDMSEENDEGELVLFYPSLSWWKSHTFDLENTWTYSETTGCIYLK